MRKPLDMADKYEPASYSDDEPTIKTQVPTFLPQIVVDDDASDDEPTLPSFRNPILDQKQEKTYPGVGLMIVLGGGLLFWGGLAFLFFR